MKTKAKLSKNSKGNTVWFHPLPPPSPIPSPPFLKNVSNNIGTYFLKLVLKHFPDNSKYKMFNKNHVKTNYSCITNIKSIINIQNQEVITEKKTQKINYNCINNRNCLLSNQRQITTIIYRANITLNIWNYHGKIYNGIKKAHLNKDMETTINHSIIRSQERQRNFEYCRFNELKSQPKV